MESKRMINDVTTTGYYPKQDALTKRFSRRWWSGGNSVGVEVSILTYGIIAIMYWPWSLKLCNRRQQSTRLDQLMLERGSSQLFMYCSDVSVLSAHPLPADSQSVVFLAYYHLLGREWGERAILAICSPSSFWCETVEIATKQVAPFMPSLEVWIIMQAA